MVFVVAITALFIFIAANGLAVATLLRSSWTTTLPSIQRRRRLCQVALYSVPIAAIAKHLAVTTLATRSTLSLTGTLVSLVVASALPFMARNRTTRVLEGFELRDLIAGRD